jgi:hypothetical protein
LCSRNDAAVALCSEELLNALVHHARCGHFAKKRCGLAARLLVCVGGDAFSESAVDQLVGLETTTLGDIPSFGELCAPLLEDLVVCGKEVAVVAIFGTFALVARAGERARSCAGGCAFVQAQDVATPRP